MQNTEEQQDTVIQLLVFDSYDWLKDFQGTQLQQLFNHSEIQETLDSETSLIQILWTY